MAEIPTAGNGGPGGKLLPVKCPMCGKKNFAAGPEVLWPGSDGSGRELTVQPFVCENCGFIAPMLAKTQPKAGQ
jgi:predicted RNA-binding Zn-ribbon protein involved in translation (DUF1610 family)